jgi:hypothetical protein
VKVCQITSLFILAILALPRYKRLLTILLVLLLSFSMPLFEGCEYTAMPPLFDAISKGTIQVDQIQIELHAKGGYESIANLFDMADKASMRVFHKERNHWGCSGYNCVEYSFVSESFLRKANA